MLNRLCNDYWDFVLRTDPLWATLLGDRRFEKELPRIDAASRAAQEAELSGFRRRLAAIPHAGLAGDDRVTAEVLEHELDRALAERRHRFHEWDVNQLSGPQVWLFELVNFHPMDAEGSCRFVGRLDAFPRFVEEYVGNLREGVASGNVAPRVVVRRVVAQLEALLARPAAECPLMEALKRVPPDTTPAAAQTFGATLLGRATETVYPAYGRLLAFLRDEYLAVAREAVGIGWSEAGRRAYEHRIWYHTSLRLSPEEVHRIGVETLAEIRERMTAIARRLGHAGDMASFTARLRTDPANAYATREEVVAHAEALLAKATAALPRLLGRLPSVGCIVKPIEDYREKDAPAGFYYSPPEDRSRPGIFYVNTYEPHARPRCSMPALALHEAVPGHHLQVALAQEMHDLPAFRRHSGSTAYVEGWALYAELLGDDIGVYDDDLSRFGALSEQAWRAARLVVDTGIHALGWSRERALALLRENLAAGETEIANEIDRYIAWPGQALAYMLGRREIQALRRQAEEKLGPRFDVRAFHDEVLRHGALPLSVLRAAVERWLA